MKTYTDNKAPNTNNFSYDSSGRARVSELTTLFDGKTIGADDTQLWGIAGTGTNTFSNNTNVMSVTANQFLIRSSNFYLPYFSGKAQTVEMTFENFQIQAGITKRAGYFSSNAVTPFDSQKDGFWIESNSTTNKITLEIENFGTKVLSIELDEYDVIANENGSYDTIIYDWSKFTVVSFDYLWLGGANFRFFLNMNGKFVLSEDFIFAGAKNGTIFRSPNQKTRYEIRSNGGVGSLTAICSQVASEGSYDEGGKCLGIYNTTAIACNNLNTIYALKSWKLNPTFRDTVVEMIDVGIIRQSTADTGILLLIKNPTVSAPITYANNSRIQEGTPTTQTCTGGRVLHAVQVSEAGASHSLAESFLSYGSINISNVADEFVLAFLPATTNQNLHGCINLKEY